MDLSKDFQVIGRVELPDTIPAIDIPKYLYSVFLNRFAAELKPSLLQVRRPDAVSATRNPEFHQDAGTEITEFVCLWTNKFPPEIKLPDGSIEHANPNDVLLFNNSKVYHRTPKEAMDANDPDRWMVRMNCFTDAMKVKVKIYTFVLDDNAV